jgi:hypothetical protein
MIPRRQPPAYGVRHQRVSPRRAALLFLAACCLFILLAGASHSSSVRDLGPLADAPEWQRLVTLWHALLDHSSDVIYSRPRFDELVKDLDHSDSDLTALADRDLLPRQAADGLRRLVHARYAYIADHTYTTRYQVQMTGLQSARSAASWVLELQLSVLRSAYPDPDANRDLIAAAESNLTYELTFLHHLDAFEAEGARRRLALKTKEDQGQTVDWPAFDADYHRRCNLLLEAYRARRLPRARAVGDLLPFLRSLTRSRPLPPAATADLPGPDF